MGQAKARRDAGMGPRGRRFLFFFFPYNYKRDQRVTFTTRLIREAGRGLGWARRMGHKFSSKLIIRRAGGKRRVRVVGRRIVVEHTGGRWLARRKVTVC